MQKDEETLLFLAEMADVRPLSKYEAMPAKKSASPTPGQLYRRRAAERSEGRARDPLSLYLKKSVRPDDWLSFQRGGVQHGVFKKLRQGRYTIDATLDLHQRKPEQARDDLLDFVNDCMAQGIRTVVIHHGRGGRENRALIKSFVAQWLPELEEVLAFHTAQKQHGGDKAVYVLLKKSEKLKQQNRERFSGKPSG